MDARVKPGHDGRMCGAAFVLHFRQAPSFSRRASARGLSRWPPPKRRGGRRAKRRDRALWARDLAAAWRLSARRPASLRRRAALSDGHWRPPSASSSQGVVVPPGGAPAPPERVPSEGAPAGAGPNPTNGATGSRPLTGSGGKDYMPRMEGGDKFFEIRGNAWRESGNDGDEILLARKPASSPHDRAGSALRAGEIASSCAAWGI